MCVCENSKKIKIFFFFFEIGNLFSNWEKSHLNPMGKGPISAPEDTKKIPAVVHQQEAFDSIYWKYKWWKFSISYHFVS